MQGVQGIKSEDIIEMMMMMMVMVMMMINKPSALAFFRVPFQTDLHGEVEKVCKNSSCLERMSKRRKADLRRKTMESLKTRAR